MQIDLKTNKKGRYTFYIVGIASCALIMSYIYANFISTPITEADQSSSPVNVEDKKGKSPTVINASIKKINDIAINPFVDISEIKVMHAAKENTGVVASGNEGLPQIPASFSRSTVGSLPIPSVPTGMSVPQVIPKSAPAAIKGILTGSVDENNIAIMSDGKILSTGDVYQENRITCIKRDGIEFEDGYSISYK